MELSFNEDFWYWSHIAVKVGIYLTAMASTGALLFLVILKPQDEGTRDALLRRSVSALIIFTILALFEVSVQTAALLDDGPSGLIDVETMNIILVGPMGASLFYKLASIALLMTAILSKLLRPLLSIIGSLILFFAFTRLGHATHEAWILPAVLMVHLCAISFWYGALYPLSKMLGDGATIAEASYLAEKFGKLAIMPVVVLAAAGIYFATFTLGSFAALANSPYGNLILLKLGCVIGLLGLASINKFNLVPALKSTDRQDAIRLRTSIFLEKCLFLGIFITTAIVTSTHPPALLLHYR